MSRAMLLVTASFARFWRWRNGRLEAGEQYAADQAGLARFAEAVRALRAPLWVLADLPEESYLRTSQGSMPGLEFSDTEQRRVEQALAGSPFHLVMLHERDDGDEGPVERLYLVQGGAERLQCWLDPLQSAGLPLAGVYHAAMVGRALLGKRPPAHQLLVSYVHGGGMRIGYYAHGMLRFSRLVPHLSHPMEPGRLREEVERTRYYLMNQNLLPMQAALGVRLLGLAPGAEEVMGGEPGYESQPLADTAAALRLPAQPTLGGDITPLLMGLLARGTPPGQLAPEAYLQPYRRWQWRRRLCASSMAVWLAVLAAFGGLQWVLADQRQSLAWKEQQVANLRGQAEKLLAGLPGTPAERAEMRAVVQGVAGLCRDCPAASGLLFDMAAALEDAPLVRLQHLGWDAGKPVRLQISGAIDDQQGTAALQLANLRRSLEAHGWRGSGATDGAGEGGERRFTLGVERPPT